NHSYIRRDTCALSIDYPRDRSQFWDDLAKTLDLLGYFWCLVYSYFNCVLALFGLGGCHSSRHALQRSADIRTVRAVVTDNFGHISRLGKPTLRQRSGTDRDARGDYDGAWNCPWIMVTVSVEGQRGRNESNMGRPPRCGPFSIRAGAARLCSFRPF